jgi:hypothetical protein
MRGTVISVLIPNNNAQRPTSDATESPYMVKLVDGSTHKVSPEFLASILDSPISTNNKISFPT